MAFNIGETVGDYQVVGVLGTGGMGKVYKVRNTISDRVEAMKVLLPDLVNEGELADRFIREIKLLASLNHPNIAALHTALRLSNQLLMVMEFVEGRTLEDRLKEGRLPAPEAIDCVSQVLSALAYAHERGVVHRDIKPANMMLTPDGQVKLMDFGIAKAVADRRLTMTGTTLGSLFYMSPEQVKGSADLDGRSDLYSVGVSLYEMVTGTRPFKGDSDYSIMVAHLEQRPVPPIQVDPTLAPALNELILTAIEKDPAKRFQSAQAFRGALQGVRASLAPAPAPPPAAVVQPRPTAPTPPPRAAVVQPPLPPVADPQPAAPARRGLWIALGALVMLAMLAVAAIQLPRWYRARAAAEPSPQPVQPAPAAPVTPAPAVPVAQPPAEAPAAPVPAAPAVIEREPGPVAPRKPVISEKRVPAPAPSATAAPAASVPVQPQQPTQPPAAPPRAEAPAQPAVDTAALEAQNDRYNTVVVRANALRPSLQNLERQQQAMGVGMRTDITTAWSRLELFLNQAAAALKAGNVAAAKKNVDAAETEADKLDRFLGH